VQRSSPKAADAVTLKVDVPIKLIVAQWERLEQHIQGLMDTRQVDMAEDFVQKLSLKLCVYTHTNQSTGTSLRRLGLTPGCKTFEELANGTELAPEIKRQIEAIVETPTLRDHPALQFAHDGQKLQMTLTLGLHGLTRCACAALVASWMGNEDAYTNAVLELTNAVAFAKKLLTPQTLELLTALKSLHNTKYFHQAAEPYLGATQDMIKTADDHLGQHYARIATACVRRLDAARGQVTPLFDQSFADYAKKPAPERDNDRIRRSVFSMEKEVWEVPTANAQLKALCDKIGTMPFWKLVPAPDHFTTDSELRTKLNDALGTYNSALEYTAVAAFLNIVLVKATKKKGIALKAIIDRVSNSLKAAGTLKLVPPHLVAEAGSLV